MKLSSLIILFSIISCDRSGGGSGSDSVSISSDQTSAQNGYLSS